MPRNRTSKIISQEDIFNMIRDYVKNNEVTPTYAQFIKYSQTVGLGCNPRSKCYFGKHITWNEILKLSKVKVNVVGSYTKKELLEKLKDYHKKHKTSPSQKDCDDLEEMPMSKTYCNHFGTFNNALLEAELPLNQEKNKYSKQDCINIILQWMEANKRVPCQGEILVPCLKVFLTHFRNWGSAIRAAGFEPNRQNSHGRIYKSNHGHIRPSQLEGKLDDFIGVHGIIHTHDFKYSEIYSTSRHFSFDFEFQMKWFVEYAGKLTRAEWEGRNFVKPGTQKWDYLENFKEKMKIIEKNSHLISGKIIIIFKDDNYKDKIKPVIEDLTLLRINNDINEHGKVILEPTPMKSYTDEDLLNYIRLRRSELGHMPALFQMQKKGFPSIRTYSRRHHWKWYIDQVKKDISEQVN